MNYASSRPSSSRFSQLLLLCLPLWFFIHTTDAARSGFLQSLGFSLQGGSQSGMECTTKDDTGGILSAAVYFGIPRNVISSIGKSDETSQPSDSRMRALRHNEFKSIGPLVEKWADDLLRENNDPEAGWTAIECNRALRQKYNRHGTTRQYVKWMRDSREGQANQKDTKKHPCMKLHTTIDAPFHWVCRYLSQEHRYREYNSLLVDHEDIEELTPDSKICWSQTKKILFIQPRDFVTFCYHKWKRDGTQVIVSQACEHPDAKKDDGFRAYSLRGATYIQRDPSDPSQRTRIILLAHCNCGDDIPEWAVRTAVGVLGPIKPYEIVHRITEGVRRAQQELDQHDVYSAPLKKGVRSKRPAGIANMGYACFWPKGGGIVESH